MDITDLTFDERDEFKRKSIAEKAISLLHAEIDLTLSKQVACFIHGDEPHLVHTPETREIQLAQNDLARSNSVVNPFSNGIEKLPDWKCKKCIRVITKCAFRDSN